MDEKKIEEMKGNKQCQYHYEEDQKFIRKTQLKKILGNLVRDVMDEKPENIYAFMQDWAVRERAKVKG